MNKRALILAAGRGSRMGAATDNSHKCLTILSDKTLLEWQLQAIRNAGIDNITVVRGYRAELLTGNFNTVNNPRWAETNMVGSLFCAPTFEGETIISYSDIVYKAAHINKLRNFEGDITVVADLKWKELWEKRFENPLDDAETFRNEGNQLLEIGGKTKNIEEIQAQYMGLIKLSVEGWKTLYNLYCSYSSERRDKTDMTSLLADALKNRIYISVVFVEGGWCEVDNYNDVMVYESQIATGNDWSHNWQQ